MFKTKENTDFEAWFEAFADALEEILGWRGADRGMAKRLYDRGYTPERAAKSDADFMMNG